MTFLNDLAMRSAQIAIASEEQLTLDRATVDRIWMPTFSIRHLINFSKLETMRPVDSVMVLPDFYNDNSEDDGFVFYQQGVYVVQLKCPMNFNRFPFDKHTCYFEVRP